MCTLCQVYQGILQDSQCAILWCEIRQEFDTFGKFMQLKILKVVNFSIVKCWNRCWKIEVLLRYNIWTGGRFMPELNLTRLTYVAAMVTPFSHSVSPAPAPPSVPARLSSWATTSSRLTSTGLWASSKASPRETCRPSGCAPVPTASVPPSCLNTTSSCPMSRSVDYITDCWQFKILWIGNILYTI